MDLDNTLHKLVCSQVLYNELSGLKSLSESLELSKITSALQNNPLLGDKLRQFTGAREKQSPTKIDNDYVLNVLISNISLIYIKQLKGLDSSQNLFVITRPEKEGAVKILLAQPTDPKLKFFQYLIQQLTGIVKKLLIYDIRNLEKNYKNYTQEIEQIENGEFNEEKLMKDDKELKMKRAQKEAEKEKTDKIEVEPQEEVSKEQEVSEDPEASKETEASEEPEISKEPERPKDSEAPATPKLNIPLINTSIKSGNKSLLSAIKHKFFSSKSTEGTKSTPATPEKANVPDRANTTAPEIELEQRRTRRSGRRAARETKNEEEEREESEEEKEKQEKEKQEKENEKREKDEREKEEREMKEGEKEEQEKLEKEEAERVENKEREERAKQENEENETLEKQNEEKEQQEKEYEEREKSKKVKKEREPEIKEEKEPKKDEKTPPRRITRSTRASSHEAEVSENPEECEEKEKEASDLEDKPSRKRKRSASRQSARKRQASSLNKKFINVSTQLLANISLLKFSSPFLTPVNENDAPNYYTVIREPRDIKTIRTKVRTGEISTAEELQRDIMLMFANAVMYNRTNTEMHRWAVEMLEETLKLMALFAEAERDAQV